MTKKQYSPLDMKPTIDWYASHSREIAKKIYQAIQNQPGTYQVQIINGKASVGISKDYIKRILQMFPQEALNRSVLEKILLKPTLWFDRNSEEKQNPTANSDDALTPTALIPSYTNYKGWTPEKPTATIELYKIPSALVGGRDIARIIATQGLIHEVGHTIIAPSQYTDQKLVLPDGKLVTGEKAIEEFATLAEKQEPISHYSANFRNPDGTFVNTEKKPLTTSISEELAESITAYLLGFTYTKNKTRRMKPFADRPEIKQFVYDFLYAKKGE